MSSFLKEGAIFKFIGRATVKENGEADIIVEKIETIQKGQSSSSSVKQKKIASGLYLKVSSLNSDEYNQTRNIIFGFKGNIPVIIKAEDTGKAVRLLEDSWVTPNSELLMKLKAILGQENVVVVE
jgi:DNA polymerase-3 subunit alpha